MFYADLGTINVTKERTILKKIIKVLVKLSPLLNTNNLIDQIIFEK